MSCFLHPPFSERALRDAPGVRHGRQHHFRIARRTYFVDKEIVIAGTRREQSGKTSVLKKRLFLIRQIAPHTHIWMSRHGHTKILHRIENSIILDARIHRCLLLKITAITNHHLSFGFAESLHHLGNPLL